MGASLEAAIAECSKSARVQAVEPQRGSQTLDHAASAPVQSQAAGSECASVHGSPVLDTAAHTTEPEGTAQASSSHTEPSLQAAQTGAAAEAAPEDHIAQSPLQQDQSTEQIAAAQVTTFAADATSAVQADLQQPTQSNSSNYQPPAGAASAPAFLVASPQKRPAAPQLGSHEWQFTSMWHQGQHAAAQADWLQPPAAAQAGLTAAQARQVSSSEAQDLPGYGDWFHSLWRVPVVDGTAAVDAQLPSERSGYVTERDESGAVSEAGAPPDAAPSALLATGKQSRAQQLREATRQRLLASGSSASSGDVAPASSDKSSSGQENAASAEQGTGLGTAGVHALVPAQ